MSYTFGRYRHITLQFRMSLEADIFQKKIDKLSIRQPNVFSIADHILISGFNQKDKDSDAMLDRVIRVCRKADLYLNKYMCLFRCTSSPILGEIISQWGISPDPRKVKALMDMPLQQSKKDWQSFQGIPNCLS